MLILHCPNCGVDADETELAAGRRGASEALRPGRLGRGVSTTTCLPTENPRGVHFERWRHAQGCGKWFHAARDTDDAGGVRHLSGADHRTAKGHPRRDHAPSAPAGPWRDVRMSTRLATGGRLLEPRPRRSNFTFNGKRLTGYAGRHAGLGPAGQWPDADGPVVQVSPPARDRGQRRGRAERAGQPGPGRAGSSRTSAPPRPSCSTG